MTHTKGPWERVDTPDYAEIHPIGRREKSAIALVGKPGDADLIASAPDILEALKQCQNILAILIDPKHKGSGIDNMVAWANCVAAEKKAREIIQAAPGQKP